MPDAPNCLDEISDKFRGSLGNFGNLIIRVKNELTKSRRPIVVQFYIATLWFEVTRLWKSFHVNFRNLIGILLRAFD